MLVSTCVARLSGCLIGRCGIQHAACNDALYLESRAIYGNTIDQAAVQLDCRSEACRHVRYRLCQRCMLDRIQHLHAVLTCDTRLMLLTGESATRLSRACGART